MRAQNNEKAFFRDEERNFIIPDECGKTQTMEINENGKIVTKDGAVLNQDGKELRLTILDPKGLSLSVISLDPPPLEIDKTIENLKRIEIRMPAYILDERQGLIRVRLAMD